MEELQLEVGKTYEVRDPDYCKRLGYRSQIKIVSFENNASKMLFLGDDGDYYTKDGQLGVNDIAEFDLVREVTIQSSPPQ